MIFEIVIHIRSIVWKIDRFHRIISWFAPVYTCSPFPHPPPRDMYVELHDETVSAVPFSRPIAIMNTKPKIKFLKIDGFYTNDYILSAMDFRFKYWLLDNRYFLHVVVNRALTT